MVGFVDHGSTRVAAGAPVCPEGARAEVADAFEAAAHQGGLGVCYFGVEGHLGREWREYDPERWICLGAQPCWDPRTWREDIQKVKSMRQQFNRARNKGVVVEEWNTARAEGSSELEAVLAAWLVSRGLPPLHFLVEPETLNFLEDRRTFVAMRNGKPVAFLNLCPIPARKGWLTEQFPRTPDAPNGTVELLMNFAAETVAAEGSEFLTMGLVPLSRRVDPGKQPWWFRFISGWVRAHGRRFYNFDGLEAFKTKFRPQWWEPLYAIVDDSSFKPRHLIAIAGAFTGGSPVKAVARAVWSALKTEIGLA